MRWPWQRERPEPPPAPAPRETMASTEAADRVPPSGWAFLPPLQRTIDSARLTLDPGRFTGTLSSWSDPSFTGRMSHLVSAQAPPGVIDVDGGGPVPADPGYPAGSGEMTLLLPPAPPVRPKPGGDGVSATAQRMARDGGAPAGGSLDGGFGAGVSADGRSLLAADPATFPVLHVDPSPIQSSDSPPATDPMTLARSLPDTEVTGPAASVGEPDISAPTPAPEAFWSKLPGESGPTRSGDSSTSDGGATYVQIPPAPAIQRTSSGLADGAPSFGQIPRRAKLGLGMPLSFSESGPELAAAPEPPPVHVPGPLPLPVQRALKLDLPASPSAPSAVDGGHEIDVERIDPDAGGGTDGEVGLGSPPDWQAAGDSGTRDPQSREPVAEVGPRTQELLPDAESGLEAEAAGSTPTEAESAPLLSVGEPAGTFETAQVIHAGGGGSAPQSSETSSAMPVVSRLGTDDRRTDSGGLEQGSQYEESGPAQTADAVSAPELHEDTVVAHSGDGPRHDFQVIEHILPPTPGHNEAGADEAAPEATPLLQHNFAIQSGSSLQRNISDGAPPAGTAPFEDEAHRADLPLPPRGSGGSRSPEVPVGSGKADAGKPEALTPSTPSSVPGVQRAHESQNATAARAIPTAAGPVVLRLVRSAAGVSSPETWQRLTSMPVIAPIPTGRSGSQPAPGMPPEVPAAGIARSEVDDTGVAAITRSTDSDSGTGFTRGGRVAPAADAEEASGFDVDSDAPPDPSTAVGRALQRTIALPAARTAESSAWSARGTLAHMSVGAATTAHAPAGAPPPSVSIQRSRAFATATPGTTRSTASPWAPESSVAMPALAGYPDSPAEYVTEYRPATSPMLTLSLAAAASPERGQNHTDVQRDAEIPPPDPALAAPATSASPTSAPEQRDGGSDYPGAESEPAGAGSGQTEAAPKAQAPAGAAAPGNAAQASPEQLEELAKRLAGPLIRRIKAEMLLDRERRGLRTDVN